MAITGGRNRTNELKMYTKTTEKASEQTLTASQIDEIKQLKAQLAQQNAQNKALKEQLGNSKKRGYTGAKKAMNIYISYENLDELQKRGIYTGKRTSTMSQLINNLLYDYINNGEEDNK